MCITFTALQQYVNQYGKQPDSIVSTVANQAFQKHFFPYVLLQLLLLSRWVTRSLRVQLNLCGGPSTLRPTNSFQTRKTYKIGAQPTFSRCRPSYTTESMSGIASY